MNYVNHISLAGTVGSLQHTEINGKKFHRFTIATNRAHLDADHQPVITTTWFICRFWDNKRHKFPEDLQKYDCVKVEGRMDSVEYVGEDGTTRTSYEVLATSVEKLNEKIRMEPSRPLAEESEQ